MGPWSATISISWPLHYTALVVINFKSSVQFSSVVLFHDLGCIENITYKNRGQEKGRSSKTIYVKTCRVSAWLLHHINTHQTLITTRTHIKQSRKTHKTDAKKKEWCLCTIQSKLLQQTSDASKNSHVNNMLRSKMIHACRRIILVYMHILLNV